MKNYTFQLKLALISVAALISIPAFAKWVEIDPSESREFTIFYDPSSITRDGVIAKIKVLKNYKSPQKSVEGEPPAENLSSIAVQEIDCSKNKYRPQTIQKWSEPNGSGKLIQSYDYSSKKSWGQWVKTTTIEGVIVGKACGAR